MISWLFFYTKPVNGLQRNAGKPSNGIKISGSQNANMGGKDSFTPFATTETFACMLIRSPT
jgi:hypothetical protein